MMYLNFSDLETALLPYFLFVAYAAILLWIRSVRENPLSWKGAPLGETPRPHFPLPGGATVGAIHELPLQSGVGDSPQPEQTDFVLNVPDPLADEFERELVNRVMTPKPVTRKRQSKSIADFIALEFEQSDVTHPDKV